MNDGAIPFRRALTLALLAAFGTATQGALADSGWSIESPEHLDTPDRIESADPRGDLTALIEQLRKNGDVQVYARVDADSRTIEIREAEIKAEGVLAPYVRDSLESTQRHLPLTDLAAEARGGRPAISYGQVKDGTLPVTAEVNEADRTVLAAMVSSYGGRNTGENIISGLFRTGAGGWIFSGGYSHGVEAISPSDSKGGRYDALQLSAMRPAPVGVFSLRGAYADSKQGGDFADFDLNGTTYRASIGWSYPVEGLKPYVNLNHYYQESNIGIVALEGDQKSTAVEIGVETDHKMDWGRAAPLSMTLDASLERGLSASNSGFGLGRELDSNWTRLAVDANASQPLGSMLLSMSAGLQSNSGMLPNQRDFVIGGQHRGSGYRAGIASVSEGHYAGLRLFTPAVDFENGRIRPFVGYNMGSGKPMIGDRRTVESVEIGTVMRFGDHFSGEVGYARVTNDRNVITDDSDGRLNFNLVARF
ncbi:MULTISPECIES: ShlB/FhaC/HecB family hemolysin secretion/activation protein [unclassified Thioalkalivibrio]|uniref:ShlB/FhaC/HecB family hemolysin secretion/activation protein n=1 Tax=unclassified Thioalkalivibrio TaxID=2621013 RepID=UPI00037BFA96|nr:MULTISPECIES: ShlB/FhaC/HecB family hemolysin secretion/activation protein [unclassified Thioalkalivibrio]